MEKTTVGSADVPTALPGVEEDDAREKLLLDASDDLDDTTDDEIDVSDASIAGPKKHRRRVLRTFGAFAFFVCVLVVGIAWFFGMGCFSKPMPQAVNRSGQKDAQTTSPPTEDEKLKIALGMIAPAPPPDTALRPDSSVPADTVPTTVPTENADVDGKLPNTGTTPITGIESYSLSQTEKNASVSKPIPRSSPNSVPAANDDDRVQRTKLTDSDGAKGRSLFFGIPRRPLKEEGVEVKEPETSKPTTPIAKSPAQIPFGAMLPVRLIGSIYTLQKSGGFVRLELTRPVEGKGYAYPAGTMIVGEVRGGESVRAFVNVMGLIDPVSGEVARFSGELLGMDGASGIEGKRRNLTSQWFRFFQGMKETATSVLGSVGALRSRGPVILSEPIRRGSESMTEDLSGALFKGDRENTFLEVPAGSNGYVLVTSLPETSVSTANKTTKDAVKQ